MGWGLGSVTECWPSKHSLRPSIPTTNRQTKTFVGEEKEKKNIWSKRKQGLFHNSLIVIITLSTQTSKDRMKTREAGLR